MNQYALRYWFAHPCNVRRWSFKKFAEKSHSTIQTLCVCVCVSICRSVWCQRHWAVTETAHHEAVWAQQEVPPCLLPGQPQTSCGSDACSSSLPCMPPSQLVSTTVAQNNEVNILSSPLAFCDVTLEPDHSFGWLELLLIICLQLGHNILWI